MHEQRMEGEERRKGGVLQQIRKEGDGREVHYLLSLGCHSKQAEDKRL
jgi:hypothetical protein